MTTKIISTKKWRENMTKVWKESKGTKIQYIIMNHSTPMFKVEPIHEEELTIETPTEEINLNQIAKEGGAFNFLENEPDLYTKDDIIAKYDQLKNY